MLLDLFMLAALAEHDGVTGCRSPQPHDACMLPHLRHSAMSTDSIGLHDGSPVAEVSSSRPCTNPGAISKVCCRRADLSMGCSSPLQRRRTCDQSLGWVVDCAQQPDGQGHLI